MPRRRLPFSPPATSGAALLGAALLRTAGFLAAGFLTAALLLAALALFAGCGPSVKKPLRLATTATVVDSGLLKVLLPAFEEQSGYAVVVTAVGSANALFRLHEDGADVALTHAPELELDAVRKGTAIRRTPVMHDARGAVFSVMEPTGGARADATAARAFAAYLRSPAARALIAGFVPAGAGPPPFTPEP